MVPGIARIAQGLERGSPDHQRQQAGKVTPQEIKEGTKIAEDILKSIDPKEILPTLKALVNATDKNGNNNYLLEMAKASQVLGETIQKVAQTDVEMQKFDDETISAQIKNLKTMLKNI